MSISGETVVSVVIGGIITAGVATVIFWAQERRARQSFEVLARFLENFANIVNHGGEANVGFTRDAKGRITNANMRYTLKLETGALLVEGHLATLRVTPAPASETRNKTESGPQDIS
jgi:hypothetical protein